MSSILVVLLVLLLILVALPLILAVLRLRNARRNAQLTPKEAAAVMSALDEHYPPPPDFRGG